MTMEILSGKACAANASAAVMRAEVESASTERTARHIMTYIVPPGHHSRTLKLTNKYYLMEMYKTLNKNTYYRSPNEVAVR